MNEQLKRRLIGAVVLVSLAVIFIPMLLDGGEEQGMSTRGTPIPAKPDYGYRTIEIPLQIPGADEPAQREQTPQVVASAEEATVLEREQTPAKPEPASTQASAPEPSASQSLVKAAEPVVPAPKSAAPKVPAATSGPESWVVQLGSFGKAANAIALRDKLRAGGYPAFVEQLKASGGISYRVRVGPELKRERAESLKGAIAKRLGLQGMVMPNT